MAVPTYPSTISLGNIQTEFGGSNPISMSEYYSGGSYVPTGTANSTGTTIPTTGTISFINFSGAIKVTNIGWWQFRYQPNTAHTTYNSYDLEPGLMNFMRSTANTNTFMTIRYAYGTGMNTYLAWVGESGGPVVSTKSATGPQAVFYPHKISFANDDSSVFVYATGTATANMMANISPTGTVNWAINANSLIYNAVAVTGNVLIFAKNSSNLIFGKVSASDGTTQQWMFSPCTTSTTAKSGSCMWVTANEAMVIYSTSSSSGSFHLYQFFVGNGTLYSCNSSSRIQGAIYTHASDRTDPSGNIYYRAQYSTVLRDFGSIGASRKPPVCNWLKSVPNGNTIYCHATDGESNTYICYGDGISNTYLVKLDAGGSISWQRKIRSSRTGGTGTFQPVVNRIIAKPDQFVMVVNIIEKVYNSKWGGSWQDSGYPEMHIIRLPAGGGNTGTYSNLIYESTSVVAFESQTAFSFSSLTPTTNYNAVPLLTTNTLTLTTNTSKNFQGVAI